MIPMRIRSLERFQEGAVLLLLTFTILWKGGKTLESTWLLFGIAAACFLWYFLKNRRMIARSVGNHEMLLTLVLFLLWTAASYLFSSTQNYGLDELLREAGLIFLFLWIVWHTDAPGEPTARIRLFRLSFEEQFISLFTFLTVLCCTVGIVVYTFQPVNRLVGTFFDSRFHTDYWPNAFAEFLLLAWPIVLLKAGTRMERGGLSFHRYHLKDKILRYLPIGLVIGCLLLSYSRGALIAFIGQIALLTLLLWFRTSVNATLVPPLRHLAASLLIGFTVFASVNELRSVVHPVQSFGEKITFHAAEGSSSIDERFLFFRQALILSARRPVFGWGPYSFRFVQPRLQKDVLQTSDHAHNVFLKLAAERGVFAMLLFGFFLFIVMRKGIQLSLAGKRFSETSDHVRLGFSLLTISLAGVIAHNLIDYNLQFVGIALPFWIIMAIVVRHAPEGQKQRSLPSWLSKDRILATFAWSAFVLFLIASREGWYLVTSSLGRHAEAAGEQEKALEWYEASRNEWFTRDLFLSQSHILADVGQREKAHESLEQYRKQNQQDARLWKLSGQLAMEEDNFASAIEAYERAHSLAAWNDLGISRGLLEALFAETYMQPTSDAAADSMRLALHPRISEVAPLVEKRVFAFAEAIHTNTHFVALSPNPEEAVKILIMLSVLYPEKIEIYHLLKGSIEAKAEEERALTKAREPGWLW